MAEGQLFLSEGHLSLRLWSECLCLRIFSDEQEIHMSELLEEFPNLLMLTRGSKYFFYIQMRKRIPAGQF